MQMEEYESDNSLTENKSDSDDDYVPSESDECTSGDDGSSSDLEYENTEPTPTDILAKDIHSPIHKYGISPRCYVSDKMVDNDMEHVVPVRAFKCIATLLQHYRWDRAKTIGYLRKFTCNGAYMSGSHHSFKSRTTKIDQYAVGVMEHLCSKYISFREGDSNIDKALELADVKHTSDIRKFRALITMDPMKYSNCSPNLLEFILAYSLTSRMNRHALYLNKVLEQHVVVGRETGSLSYRHDVICSLRYWQKNLDEYTKTIVEVFLYIVEPVHSSFWNTQLQEDLVRNRIVSFVSRSNARWNMSWHAAFAFSAVPIAWYMAGALWGFWW